MTLSHRQCHTPPGHKIVLLHIQIVENSFCYRLCVCKSDTNTVQWEYKLLTAWHCMVWIAAKVNPNLLIARPLDCMSGRCRELYSCAKLEVSARWWQCEGPWHKLPVTLIGGMAWLGSHQSLCNHHVTILHIFMASALLHPILCQATSPMEKSIDTYNALNSHITHGTLL